MQDASDGYIPYEWKEKVGTDYKLIENTTYKKDYSVAIGSNKDFSVSFVQRYAVNNGVLSIAHPKGADGNIEPDTKATELIIPATVNGVEVTAIAGNTSGKKGVFEGWTELKKVTFPETLTTIGARAFAGCTNLTDFPKDCSVTTINGNAFDGCTALKTLELPASCTTIQGEAFNNCSGLGTVTFNSPNLAGINFGYLLDKSAFTGCTEISTINFKGDGIFSIGGTTTIATTPRRIHMLFPSAATKLTTVIFGDGITAFKGDTPYFVDCSALETVDLGKNNKGYNGKLPNSIFNGCKSLKKVTLCDDIEAIGNIAFKGCESLKSITLPANLTKMGDEVFAACSSLETIKLSDILTNLGTATFSGCKALKSISIPKGVTSLAANVFKDCEALTELDLRNVTTIASGDVFSGCTSITKLIVNQGVKITALIANNLKILIGLSTIEVQTAADVSEKQTLAVNLSTLCGDAVQGKITSIIIGDKVGIPTGTSLTNLASFKNAELKFSVPSDDWKKALVGDGTPENTGIGIDAAKVIVR
ncbi:MAG: leucine-rich repeat domain-containing protein [Treponemataceae bacterium]